jgi:hypothetical protein
MTERYQVTNHCDECNGAGIVERRTAVDSYRSSPCEWCDGYGETIDQVDGYDSVDEVRDDYPRATSIRRIASASGAVLEMPFENSAATRR